jgi:4-hydroxybutyrate CoA-transferase
MQWQEDYRRKLISADEALRAVDSDSRVFVHANGGFPQVLLEALARRGPRVRDVEVVHILGFGEPYYTAPELQESFRHNAMFIGGNTRDAVREGRADYNPIHLSEIEHLFASGEMPLDIALIHVAPPDRFGFCNMGVSVEIALTAARHARYVIAQVNAAHLRQQLPARARDRRLRRVLGSSAADRGAAADTGAQRNCRPYRSPH